MKDIEQLASIIRYPVAIFGWGVSGRAAAELLHHLGASIEVFDEKEGENAQNRFTASDASIYKVVVCSPGFKADHPWLGIARDAGCRILGEIDLSALLWRGRIIAVTGTNGKTTLSEFLAYALRRSGVDAMAVGNNGYAFSRLLLKTDGGSRSIAVCEVSSYQAEQAHNLSPAGLIWTNFEEDHLDRYACCKDYFAAKWRLVEMTATGPLFVGSSVSATAAEFGFSLPDRARVVSREEAADIIPVGSPFLSWPQQENYLLARAWWLSEGYDEASLREAAVNFSLPRHRLSHVAELDGIGFWNDSKATNFGSVYAAFESFERPIVWIGGGRAKGGDIVRFGSRIAARVKFAALTGETAPLLAEQFEKSGVPHAVCSSLDAAVIAASKAAIAGDVVLFSPGFASFDQFRSYSDRGISFERTVLSLKKQPVEVNR